MMQNKWTTGGMFHLHDDGRWHEMEQVGMEPFGAGEISGTGQRFKCSGCGTDVVMATFFSERPPVRDRDQLADPPRPIGPGEE